MKLTSSINLISAINRQKLDNLEMIELVNSLGEHCTPAQLIAFARQQKEIHDIAGIEEGEKIRILNQLEKELLNNIHTSVADLRKLNIYRVSHKLAEGKESFISDFQTKADDLKKLIINLVNLYESEGGGYYGNVKIHPTLKVTGKRYTPDYKIDLDVPAQTFKIAECYFDVDYMGYNDQSKKHIYKTAYSMSFNLPSLFYKDITLLQICCIFGLEDLIEKSIIFGANINHKEKISGLKALDMYQASPNLDAGKKAYIISLLDGTYDNGKYQALYEKKQLNEQVPIMLNPSISAHKI